MIAAAAAVFPVCLAAVPNASGGSKCAAAAVTEARAAEASGWSGQGKGYCVAAVAAVGATQVAAGLEVRV